MFTPAFPRVSVMFAALLSMAVVSTVSSENVWIGEAAAQSVRSSNNSQVSNRLYIKRKRQIARRNDRIVIQNQLQSQRRARAVLANPQRRNNPGVVVLNSYSGGYHSGIILRGNRRDNLFIQRKREINRRNDRIVIENALQSERRSAAVLANPPSRPVIDDGLLTTTSNSVARASVLPCPTKYNCGYRLYSDGTGPRIITPGIPAGNGLPAFDGVSGPVILTPYD